MGRSERYVWDLHLMFLLFAYLALAIVVSFACSISEAVLLSVRSTYIATLARRGSTGAKALTVLKANLDRPLAAILTLNTIAHTVGAAGVGAQAAIVFGNEYVGIASAILTLLILVLSEIIPKTLGAAHWRSLAPATGIVIFWLTKIMFPLVWLAQWLTRRLSRTGASAFTFSRDEMEAMAQIGETEGVLDERERKIVSNLMGMHSLSVRSIMTPRSVIFSVPETMTVGEYFATHAEVPFSRIPIFKDLPDEITAYALKSDVFAAQARDEFERRLDEFSREFFVIPDFSSVFQAFDRLTQNHAHVALIVDEYGQVQGLVTLEDVVETLFGFEIVDELDTVKDMQALAKQSWRKRMRRLGIDPDTLAK